jgi:hypothetical protein
MISDNTLLNIDAEIANANSIKEMVLHRLLKDGLITEETAIKYAENWQVIVINNSWFKRWMEKFKRNLYF